MMSPRDGLVARDAIPQKIKPSNTDMDDFSDNEDVPLSKYMGTLSAALGIPEPEGDYRPEGLPPRPPKPPISDVSPTRARRPAPVRVLPPAAPRTSNLLGFEGRVSALVKELKIALWVYSSSPQHLAVIFTEISRTGEESSAAYERAAESLQISTSWRKVPKFPSKQEAGMGSIARWMTIVSKQLTCTALLYPLEARLGGIIEKLPPRSSINDSEGNALVSASEGTRRIIREYDNLVAYDGGKR